MIAEAKVHAVHYLARNVIERLVKPVPLEHKEGATLESARLLDQLGGDFHESAQHYYTVYQRADRVVEQAAGLIGLSQQLINLRSFRQVRQLLHLYRGEPAILVDHLPEAGRLLFQAQVREKEGWINDYELGFFQSQDCFTQAGNLLEQIPSNDWGSKTKECYSTTRHFLGRAHYGLAAFGVDRAHNVPKAIEYFDQALELDEQFFDKTG